MTTERFNAHVGADIKEFKRKMKEVDRAMRETATGATAEIDVALDEFYAEMRAVRKELKGIDGKQARVEVELAYLEFKRQMAELYAIAETLDDYEIDVEVDAAITQFRKKLMTAKALAQGLDGEDIDVDVKLHTRRFFATLARVTAALTALDTKSFSVWIKLKYQDFQNNMARVAASMRNWGEIISTNLTGALISLIPTLSPIISSLVGLIGSLGVMIGVLGGQLLILSSAITSSAFAFGGLAAVAIPTIKTLFDETAKLTAEQQRARDAWDGFIDVYDELVSKAEGAVLEAFTSAMEGAQKILTSLEPMILKTADAMARLMQAFSQSIDSAPIQAIFETFNTFSADIFGNMVAAIGSFVAGIGSLMAALTPAAATWSESFRAMGEDFAAWAAGLSESEKFQEFIAYVQEHMPIISQIFGDLVVGIVDFFAAFAPLASDFMVRLSEMTQGFRDWAAALSENTQFQTFVEYIRESTPKVLDLIGNLTNFLVNMGVAMAPMGAIVLGLVNGFLSWVNSMMESHTWFSKLVGFIPTAIGAFLMFMAPLTGLWTLIGKHLVSGISTVIGWFGKLSGAISKVTPYIAPLIDDVARLFSWFGKVGGTIASLASKALPLLGRAFGLLTGPVGIAIAIITSLIQVGVWLYKNWEDVSAAASRIWTGIKNFLDATIGTIVKAAIKWFGDMYNGIVKWMGEIVTGITNGWNNAKRFLESINLLQIGKNIIAGLISGITSKFGDVAASLSKLTDKIPSWVKSALGIKSPSRVMMEVGKWIPAGLGKGISDNINYVKQAVKEMHGAVSLDFSKEIDKTTYGYKQMIAIADKAYKSAAKQGIIERFEAFEQGLSDYKRFSQVTLAEEREFWLEAARLTEDGTAVKNTMLRKAADIQAQILQQQYETEQHFLDKAEKYNALSLRERISAMEDYMKQYQLGSAQQIAYEERIYDAKVQLYKDLQSIAMDYLGKIQDVYSKLADEESKLRDEYQKTFDARKDAIANTWGLFDAPNLTDMSEVDIVGNMRKQFETMSGWMHDLFRLEGFGIDEALLTELQALGPKAAAEIKALTNLSASELKEYEKLWKATQELAGKQATKELAGARVEMENEIVELRVNAVKEVEQLRNEMLKEMDELVNGSTDTLNVMTMSLPNIAKEAMRGFINGFKSMEGELHSTLNRIASDAQAALLFGIMEGAVSTGTIPSLATNSNLSLNQNVMNEQTFEQTPVHVTVNQMWSGEDVLTYIEEEQAINRKLEVRKG